MKTTNKANFVCLEPDKGYMLRNKDDKTIIAYKVLMPLNSNGDNWEEVEEAQAIQDKEEIEKERQEQEAMKIEEIEE
jgi:hypothetical protein